MKLLNSLFCASVTFLFCGLCWSSSMTTDNCLYPSDSYYTPIKGVPDFGFLSTEHVHSMKAAFKKELNRNLKLGRIKNLNALTKKDKEYEVADIVFLSGDLNPVTHELIYEAGVLAHVDLSPVPRNPNKKEREALEAEEVNDNNSRFFPEPKKEENPFFVMRIYINPAKFTEMRILELKQDYFWQDRYHYGGTWEQYLREVKISRRNRRADNNPLATLDLMKKQIWISEEKLVEIRKTLLGGVAVPEELQCGPKTVN